ncbi:molecular chaperone [Fusarium napiforme]|uniref:Molecular chaperone n=1 Tax=Fusarium napiforme TaxID=42672 RepID=A0A8H5K587_9HYPO|nr:molecular chaperone [Fusarium napiforme]
MDFVDYYSILRVPHTANQGEIKTAYRQLAKTIHPDKNHEDNQATLNFQNLRRVDRRQVEQFIRQFESCVSKAEEQVIIQKRRIEQEQEAVRVLEDEIFTAGFEMIEVYECGAGPSNLERTKEYPRIQAQKRIKAELEADLKEEEEKLASLERQVLGFSSRLSYWQKEWDTFYAESYS